MRRTQCGRLDMIEKRLSSNIIRHIRHIFTIAGGLGEQRLRHMDSSDCRSAFRLTGLSKRVFFLRGNEVELLQPMKTPHLYTTKEAREQLWRDTPDKRGLGVD